MGVQKAVRNKFNVMELAGAFGDLGTLIPFILIYITIMKFNPAQVLLVFGIFNIFIGCLYKTPIPVQPMKAIGTFAATHVNQVTLGMVSGAGLFTGAFWCLLGATGMTEALARVIKKPVVKGIALGLGLSFISEGIKMMSPEPVLSLVGVALYLLLQKYKRIPSIFIIMLFGILFSIAAKPNIGLLLANVRPSIKVPDLNLNLFNLKEFLKGMLFLAIPQIPLTLGNGVIALVEENNELFPEAKVSNRKVAMTTGLMNLVSPFLGGVPVCHGAGGMAGHVKFGARTGGATILLGVILVGLSVFFSDSLTLILNIFPKPVLGIILLLAGAELASSAYIKGAGKTEFYITVLTAGVAMWNVGAALLVGVIGSTFMLGDHGENQDSKSRSI